MTFYVIHYFRNGKYNREVIDEHPMDWQRKMDVVDWGSYWLACWEEVKEECERENI